MTHLRTRLLFTCSLLVLGGCASTGSESPSARPVLYPNAAFERMGDAKAQEMISSCTARAKGAGLSPEEKDNAVASGATKGAAIGGVAGAVRALVTGRDVVKSGAVGAAVGGSAGAVSGAFKNKPNSTYRHFVQRCLKDKGLDVIGWN